MVAIKDMKEIPKNCYEECDLHNYHNCDLTGENIELYVDDSRHPNCPLIEIEQSEDCVSRKFMEEQGATCIAKRNDKGELIPIMGIHLLPPVAPTHGTCKDCASREQSIPYLMHKEMDIPISECQKAYDVAIDYLRSQGKVKGGLK